MARSRSSSGGELTMAWFQLALVVGLLGVLAVAMRRLRVSPNADSDIDVGTVSESWLAEQRASRTDRLRRAF
jgi:hypothetical protein